MATHATRQPEVPTDLVEALDAIFADLRRDDPELYHEVKAQTAVAKSRETSPPKRQPPPAPAPEAAASPAVMNDHPSTRPTSDRGAGGSAPTDDALSQQIQSLIATAASSPATTGRSATPPRQAPPIAADTEQTEADARMLEQLDDLLAASAAKDLEGEFMAPEQVVADAAAQSAAAAVASVPPTTDADARTTAIPPEPVAMVPESFASTASDETPAQPPENPADDETPFPDSHFEPVEAVIAAAPSVASPVAAASAIGTDAPASAVNAAPADPLDHAPPGEADGLRAVMEKAVHPSAHPPRPATNAPASVAPTAVPAAPATASPRSSSSALAPRLRAITQQAARTVRGVRFEDLWNRWRRLDAPARRLCALINRPADLLAPETRRLVGLFAAAHVAVAATIILIGLAARVLG